MYAAVMFDLDGTLLNTLEDLADSLNRVLAAKGMPTHATEAFRHFVGNGAVVLVARALPPEHRTERTIKKCAAAFREDYARNWKVKTRPYAGVPEMLTALAARGIKLAVLSNKPDDFTRLCVASFFPSGSFNDVMGQRPGEPMKPDPTGALRLAAGLGIPPDGFAYVGDSDVDMQTAVRAGMLPVGALWGFRDKKELQANGARHTLAYPEDLLELI